jgi:DNA-binding XRE family transcriptional regulator
VGKRWPPSELEEWRRRRGLSQAQVAQPLGISRQYIQAIESGRIVPNRTLAEAIADVLSVPTDVVFPGVGGRA